MEMSVESTGSLTRLLRIQVSEAEVASEVEGRLQSMVKTVKVKGFRPGRVPFKVIQSKYGAQARREALDAVVQRSLNDAITRKKLQPVSTPELELVESSQKLVFTAKFEIYPEINLSPVEELKIDKPVCKITDQDVDQMVEVLRRQNRRVVEVAHPVTRDDAVLVDFTGRIDGKEFEAGSRRDVLIEIGSKHFVTGFAEGLIGAKAGEHRMVKLTLPTEYEHKELAGKEAEFEVNIKAVNELVLPDLDDEFLAVMGVTDGSIDNFRTELRRNMVRESEHKISAKVRDMVMQKLYEANKIELPESLITRELARLKEQFGKAIRKQGFSEADIPENNSMLKEQARKRVTLQLLITDIVAKNNIQVDPADVRNIIEKIASAYEDVSKVINFYYSDQKRLAEVEALALEQGVINWVLERAQIKEIELAFSTLIGNKQQG